MGAVYMAEQEHPVRRRVALKIIKPGMDSRQVIARFEAERQALALMDHQNIARVLDAGTTETGRPYFVMELVHGVPITKYCDDAQLTPRERLELFVPVCRAIQHAHQKGIIHRDIKPSNVLVTMYDGKPVAKVIDFGVAKAVDQRLTERTMFTQYGSIIGTLEYMSPEQAEMSALGVDTRSDVYALGVLLYELLTGTTPLERMSLREAGYAEILRRIKEEEPPRPSTRLSASRARAAVDLVAAEDRAGEAVEADARRARLDRDEVPGEGPDTAIRDGHRAAQDVERYLKDEPVEACPPSAGYRLRKFAQEASGAVGGGGELRRDSGGRRHRQRVAGRAGPGRPRCGPTSRRPGPSTPSGRPASERDEAEAARTEADTRRNEAEAARRSLRQSLYASDIQLAQAAWKSGSILRMRELLDSHKPRARRGRPARLRVALLAAAGLGIPLVPANAGSRGWRAEPRRSAVCPRRAGSRPRGRGRPGIPSEALGHDLGARTARFQPISRRNGHRHHRRRHIQPRRQALRVPGSPPRRGRPGTPAVHGLGVGQRPRAVHPGRSRRCHRGRDVRSRGPAAGGRGPPAGRQGGV